MELKLIMWTVSCGSIFGSNRTFMELKYVEQEGKAAHQKSSNRTFMELKSKI